MPQTFFSHPQRALSAIYEKKRLSISSASHHNRGFAFVSVAFLSHSLSFATYLFNRRFIFDWRASRSKSRVVGAASSSSIVKKKKKKKFYNRSEERRGKKIKSCESMRMDILLYIYILGKVYTVQFATYSFGEISWRQMYSYGVGTDRRVNGVVFGHHVIYACVFCCWFSNNPYIALARCLSRASDAAGAVLADCYSLPSYLVTGVWNFDTSRKYFEITLVLSLSLSAVVN